MPEYGDETSTQVRIYGRRLADTDDGLVNVVYCGFQAGVNDVRLPSARVFHIKGDEILDQGEVPGFEVGGETVRYYDLPLDANVFESRPQPIDLSAEIVKTTGGTFATLVGTPPERPFPERFGGEPMPVMDRFLSGGGDAETLKAGYACNTYRQSYYWTWGMWPHPDPWGADCD